MAARVRNDGENVGFAVHLTHVAALLRSQRAPVLFTRRALDAWAGPDSVEYPLETDIDDQTPSKAGDAEASYRVPTESLNYVQAQLRTRDSMAALIGYQPRRGIDFVSLPPFGTTPFSMELPPGSYQMIAVCDEHCGDVDLQLSRGTPPALVAEDVTGDALPTVTLAVAPGDTVLGEVRMVACRTAACVVGVRVLRREGK